MNWNRMGSGTEISSAQSLFIFGIAYAFNCLLHKCEKLTQVWDPSLPAVLKVLSIQCEELGWMLDGEAGCDGICIKATLKIILPCTQTHTHAGIQPL